MDHTFFLFLLVHFVSKKPHCLIGSYIFGLFQRVIGNRHCILLDPRSIQLQQVDLGKCSL